MGVIIKLCLRLLRWLHGDPRRLWKRGGGWGEWR
jgi:hypothetical protein